MCAFWPIMPIHTWSSMPIRIDTTRPTEGGYVFSIPWSFQAGEGREISLLIKDEGGSSRPCEVLECSLALGGLGFRLHAEDVWAELRAVREQSSRRNSDAVPRQTALLDAIWRRLVPHLTIEHLTAIGPEQYARGHEEGQRRMRARVNDLLSAPIERICVTPIGKDRHDVASPRRSNLPDDHPGDLARDVDPAPPLIGEDGVDRWSSLFSSSLLKPWDRIHLSMERDSCASVHPLVELSIHGTRLRARIPAGEIPPAADEHRLLVMGAKILNATRSRMTIAHVEQIGRRAWRMGLEHGQLAWQAMLRDLILHGHAPSLEGGRPMFVTS